MTSTTPSEARRPQLDSLLRSFADDAPIFFLAVRQDGTIAYASRSIERILGQPAEAYLEQNVLEWIHPDEIERAILQMAATSTTGLAPGITRFRVRHSDGTWKQLELFGSNVSDGVDDYTGIYARDGQHQIFLEDVLTGLLGGSTRDASLEPVLGSVQRNQAGSQVVISYWDGNDFQQISTGITDELGGGGDPTDTPWERCRSTMAMVKGSAADLDPARRQMAVDAGVDLFWIEPVVWDDDRPPATVTIWTAAGSGLVPTIHGYGMDAARYLAELILRWTQRELELEGATRRLVSQEKLASLGTLTAGVAHEIRNPLSFIKNFAETGVEAATDLRQELPSDGEQGPAAGPAAVELADELIEALTFIGKHVERIDSIVANMLGYSRDEIGPPQSTDLGNLVRTFVDLGYQGYRASGHSDFGVDLSVDTTEEIAATVRPQEIGRVIINLITNACDAVYQRGKTMPEPVGAYRPEIAVSVHKTGRRARITVTDNGGGIPEGLVERIFEPFYTTKPPGEGTGLGLSLCQDIVVGLHGGEIHVSSAPQSLTTFTVLLPLADAPEGAPTG